VGFTITQWGRNILKHNLTASERYNITVSSRCGSGSSSSDLQAQSGM
jgi:hypothetical protein